MIINSSCVWFSICSIFCILVHEESMLSKTVLNHKCKNYIHLWNACDKHVIYLKTLNDMNIHTSWKTNLSNQTTSLFKPSAWHDTGFKTCSNSIESSKIIMTMNYNTHLIILQTNIQDQSELLGQFRLIGDRASDVSGGRICLTQNTYTEI